MALKEDWKNTGKGIGHAFKNFGKAVKTSVEVGVGDKERVDEDGNPALKDAWSETGKSFGEAGKSIGKSADHTAKKVFKDEDAKEEKKEEKKPGESEVVDVESKDK